MLTRLYLAPAAAGKTAHVLARARDASRDLAAVPRVVVPTHLQARAARRRHAQVGGVIGVRMLTFDRLYAEVLDAAGEIYVELSEPVQYQVGASNLGGGLDPVYNAECGMANGGCYQGGRFQSSGVISPLPN